MTRQHAHELLFGQIKIWEGKEIGNFLTALELLGLIKFDDSNKVDVLFQKENVARFGAVRIELWPEGLMLWVGGEIAWKSWKA